MKCEFWAEFDLWGERQKRNSIRYFVGLREHPPSSSKGIRWANLEDPAARQHLLAQLLASEEECDERTKCKDYAKGKDGLQHWYYAGDLQNPRGDFQTFLCCRLWRMGAILGLVNLHDTVGSPLPNLTLFPPGSWTLQLTFTLRKPYISKDDVDFYILDNPVKKEWIFKVPYVAPSQWKGALRSAMMRDLVNALQWDKKDEDEFVEERLRLYRLFGNEKDGTAEFFNRAWAWALHRVGPRPEDKQQAEEWEQRFQETVKQVASKFENRLREEGYRVGDIEGFQGRLHFYPTFFDRIGLEVINPHDRETGAGKHPIYFECVPAGTKGTFTLLYVPLYVPLDLSDNPGKARKQAQEDLKAVAEGIRSMLTVYGFGAKTSSGYGVAEVNTVDIQTQAIDAKTVQEAQDILTQRHREHGG